MLTNVCEKDPLEGLMTRKLHFGTCLLLKGFCTNSLQIKVLHSVVL